MSHTKKFDRLFNAIQGRFNQDWRLDYFSSLEGFRELVLCRDEERIKEFVDELYNFLNIQLPDEERNSLYSSLLEYVGYVDMTPKENLERIYNSICSIAVQELGVKIEPPYTLIPMPSPTVDYPPDKELQGNYKKEYPLIYQTIQACLVEDCIVKEKQSYGQKTFLYCRTFYEVEAEEGLKEAQKLKEEKHSDEEWKRIFYSGFGMRYNLDYYQLTSENMLDQIEKWFRERLEDFEVMRRFPKSSAWDRDKMKPSMPPHRLSS